mgnify:CR=1 FL=1
MMLPTRPLKKGGTKFFKGGPIFSENIGPPGPFFLKYLVRGDCFWGDQLLRDSTPVRILQCQGPDTASETKGIPLHYIGMYQRKTHLSFAVHTF